MLVNIDAVENLRGLARIKGRNYETKTINPLLSEQSLAHGWKIFRENKRSIRLIRQKPHDIQLVDRV